ncbi:MAG: hypothetical protein HYR51_11550 [Candidatus Rokubacteria bacterium]|nr:hypothetical protein [Candidatus Rokubacteria bacterium]
MTRRIGLTLAIVFLTFATGAAQVPKPEDMASCNEKAKSEVETASASPRTDREVAPPDAKGGVLAGSPPATTAAAQEKDPQLQGIDAGGAKDPAYVAAYKTCMRQAGF